MSATAVVGGEDPARARVRGLVDAIEPFDDDEAAHRAEVLAWIDRGDPLWRTAKPATPPEHLVAYAVVMDPAADAVLLVDHRLSGRWLPPGGHIEPGEDPARTARRELAEELGLDAEPLAATGGRPVMVTRTTTVGATAGHVDVSLWYVFAASAGAELSPDPAEMAEVRWWPAAAVRHGPGTRFDPHLPRLVAKLAATG
ncbi:MAG: NUDIX domain-containing protein [Actinomycetota bacterium]|nr:NUDIX domain-containing protein [Actinomycetota bacterium]